MIHFQGENGDLKNRSGGLKVDINHLPLGGKVTGNNSNSVAGGDNFPDSSIGEGMDITIQGANGHVKNQDNQSLKSYDSKRAAAGNGNANGNACINGNGNNGGGGDAETCPRLNKYSDMSIGLGMDISIRGEGDNVNNKEADAGGWSHNGSLQFDSCNNAGLEKLDQNNHHLSHNDCDSSQLKMHDTASVTDMHAVSGHSNCDNDILSQTEIKHVEEVLIDPVDDVVVEECCPEVCYRVCPCCIGDPDSPFWQLWYRHRLQVSR